MSEKWYVLQVHGSVEESLKDFLQEMNFDAFLPKFEKVHKNQGVSHIILMPLFPNCLFVRSELTIEQIQKQVKQSKMDCEYVKEIQWDAITCLREEDVLLLEKLLDQDNIVRMSSGNIEAGCIRLDTGPLQGLENHIIKIDRHKRIASLENVILGRQVRVSLEIVKKI